MNQKTSVDKAITMLDIMVKDLNTKFAYRLLKLRCLCGYHPKMATSENVKPGQTYYFCGSTSKSHCKFFVWQYEIQHFHDSLCYCAQPTVKIMPDGVAEDEHHGFYVCVYAKYKKGCKYCRPLE